MSTFLPTRMMTIITARRPLQNQDVSLLNHRRVHSPRLAAGSFIKTRENWKQSYTIFVNFMVCHCKDDTGDVPEKTIWHLLSTILLFKRNPEVLAVDVAGIFHCLYQMWRIMHE